MTSRSHTDNAVNTEDLQDSAPLRDFVRDCAVRYDAGVVALPAFNLAQGPGGTRLQSLSAPAFAAVATAVAMVLLARHSRRNEVALTFVVAGSTSPPCWLSANVSANRPFADLVQALLTAIAGDEGTVGAACRPQVATNPAQPGMAVEIADGVADTEHVPMHSDLALRVTRGHDGTQGYLEFNRLLYREDSIVPLARQLAQLLGTVNPETVALIGELELFDEAERHRLIYGFNELRLAFPVTRTLSELIDEQVARTPGAVCAVHNGRELTFAVLDTAASRLAHLLAGLGVGPGRFVAIVDYRGLDFLVAMLAIWRAGGAYIPVDPSYPEDRVRYMLTDSEVAVACVGHAALEKFGHVLSDCSALQDLVCLQAEDCSAVDGHRWRLHDATALAAQPSTMLPARAVASDPAYMIYTSGSTGRPKGAIVRHDGAVNHLFAQGHALGSEAVGRFLQSAPSSSDISVWQFAAPLVFGGTTVIIDDPTDVENLHRQVVQYRLHIIELVPAVLKYFVEYARTLAAPDRVLPDLRWVMVTGESASVELVNAWLAIYPQIPVVNAYGPTEAADDITQAIIQEPLPPLQVTVPIGRPLANIYIYVLDEGMRPVPVGAPGEICVSGVGVGDGYWKQPDKTSQAFVPNPFMEAAGPVIYRTGDLGRLRDDGTIECLGRLDHQVKLRGFRIELQEIESVLRSHAAVRDAVVKVFHDSGGDGHLVAFLVERNPDTASDEVLRAHMDIRLPRYMVPTTLVRLAQLPLNPAGKVDRQALKPPESTARSSGSAYRAPRTSAERALSAIWQQELGAASVGLDDDFFALGGDSLAALAIAVGAREAGLQLRSADVLRHPTVAQLAATATLLAVAAADRPRRSKPSLQALVALDETARGAFLAAQPQFEDVQPLAPPQQGIYLHGLLARDKTAYIDQYQYLVEGELDYGDFEAAWNLVLARHASLRTGFLRRGFSRPVQAVHRHARVEIKVVDHSGLGAAAQQQFLGAVLQNQIDLGFELALPPLMRLVLVRTGLRLHRLIWTHHHIALDGWSMSLVLDEVLSSYSALHMGDVPTLQAPIPYRCVLEWLATEDIASAERFWRQLLDGFKGAPQLSLTAQAQAQGSSAFAQSELTLTMATSRALVTRAQHTGVTLSTLMQAAWASLLAQVSSCNDVVFGVVTSGRELAVPGIDSIVGLLVTTLPLRVEVPATSGPAVDHWLRDLQQRAATLREHEAVPLAQITRWCNLPAGRVLFETLFVMANYPEMDASRSSALRVVPDAFRTVPAYMLALIVVPGDRLLLRLIYDSSRVSDSDASRVLRELAEILTGLTIQDDLAARPGFLARPGPAS